jgi:hypothetical protein
MEVTDFFPPLAASATGQTKSHVVALHFSCVAFSPAAAPPAPRPPARIAWPAATRLPTRNSHFDRVVGRTPDPPPGRHQAGRVEPLPTRTGRTAMPTATGPAPGRPLLTAHRPPCGHPLLMQIKCQLGKCIFCIEYKIKITYFIFFFEIKT